MWRFVHDAWWRLATQHQPPSLSDRLIARALHALSLLYGAAVRARNGAYERGWAKSVSLPCRVVSVGNLTVGGTGKTACVELLARKLIALGGRVAVLSRGYGGRGQGYWLRWEAGRLATGGAHAGQPSRLPDEPQMLAQHLAGVPVVIGPRRERTGLLACRELGADTLVLDDGFQHRRVKRNCDVVLVHARMPLGGWALLPRGPMREPLDALRRADVIIVTKADEVLETVEALRERLRAVNPSAVVATAIHEPAHLLYVPAGEAVSPRGLAGKRIGLVSSIGDPQGFEATVTRLGATVAWHLAFPDHHPYDAADWAAMIQRVQAGRPELIVTTEKDWVRLRPVAESGPRLPAPLAVLGVRMTLVTGEQELDDRLARVHAR